MDSNKSAVDIKLPGYQLLERVGRGAFGNVHKALNTSQGTLVAIKIVELALVEEEKALDVDETMKEFDILKSLSHQNIVRVLDNIRTDEAICFVMEYVEGGSLRKIIKNFGTFPDSLVAIYVEQILQGLEYLHANGIIHSDIKASNLLIDKEGKIMLADFGIARRKKDGADDKPIDPSTLGSPYWMAPEVILMTGTGFKSDIWSLGCSVLELLTGDPPYISLPPMSAMFRIVEEGRPPLPSNLPKDCINFLEKCFKIKVERRPSATELLQHPWLKSKSQEEKIMLERSMSYKNLSTTVKTFTKSRSSTLEENSIDELNSILENLPQTRTKAGKKLIEEAQREIKEPEPNLLLPDMQEAIDKLQNKYASLSKRVKNIEKTQGSGRSRLERLYLHTKKKRESGLGDEIVQLPKQRIAHYRKQMKTLELHLDQLKSSLYIKAVAVKDQTDDKSGFLSFKRGDTIYLHPDGLEDAVWKGEKLQDGKVGNVTPSYVTSELIRKPIKRPKFFSPQKKEKMPITIEQDNPASQAQILEDAEEMLQNLSQESMAPPGGKVKSPRKSSKRNIETGRDSGRSSPVPEGGSPRKLKSKLSASLDYLHSMDVQHPDSSDPSFPVLTTPPLNNSDDPVFTRDRKEDKKGKKEKEKDKSRSLEGPLSGSRSPLASRSSNSNPRLRRSSSRRATTTGSKENFNNPPLTHAQEVQELKETIAFLQDKVKALLQEREEDKRTIKVLRDEAKSGTKPDKPRKPTLLLASQDKSPSKDRNALSKDRSRDKKIRKESKKGAKKEEKRKEKELKKKLDSKDAKKGSVGRISLGKKKKT